MVKLAIFNNLAFKDPGSGVAISDHYRPLNIVPDVTFQKRAFERNDVKALETN